MKQAGDPLGRGAYLRGAVLSGLGSAAVRGALFVNLLVIARYVSRAEFGAFAVLASFGAMAGTVARLGLGTAACRLIATESTNSSPNRSGAFASAAFLLWAGGSLLVLGALWPAAPRIAEAWYGRPELASGLRCFAFFGAFQALLLLCQGILQGLRAFGILALSQAISALLLVGMTLFLVLTHGFQGAVEGALLGTGAAALLTVGLAMDALRRAGGRALVRPRVREVRRLLAFSVPVFFSGSLNQPVVWLSLSILGAKGGLEELGRFGAANLFRQGLLFVITALSTPALPFLAPLADREEEGARFHRAVVQAIRLLLAVAVLLAAAAILLPEAVLLLAGRGYLDAVPVLLPLALAAVLASAGVIPGICLNTGGPGRAWLGCAANGLWAGVLLGGALLFVPGRGAEGLAWAYVLAYAVLVPGLFLYLGKRLRVSLPSLAGPGLAAAAALAGAFAFGHLAGMAARAAMLVLLWLLGAWSMLPREKRHRLLARLGGIHAQP